MEAAAGFEPANDGFANRCLRPLGYAASLGKLAIMPTGKIIKIPYLGKCCKCLEWQIGGAGPVADVPFALNQFQEWELSNERGKGFLHSGE